MNSNAAPEIKRGLLFAGLMIGCALVLKLAVRFGMIHDPDTSLRAAMVLLGAFFIASGNAIPKTLVPLAVQQCDGARAQAFQRFLGWTWVLSGLAFAVAWLVLPLALAQTVSPFLLLGGVALGVAQWIRLRRMHRKSA